MEFKRQKGEKKLERARRKVRRETKRKERSDLDRDTEMKLSLIRLDRTIRQLFRPRHTFVID